MTHKATLAQLRRLFIYHADGALDSWRVLRHDPHGFLVGDCEDFALALAFRLAGQSWPRFLWHLVICKSVIWHTISQAGNPHAVLWHRGAGWADNISPHWTPATPHKRRFPYLFPLWVLKLAAGPLFAWVDSTLKRAWWKGGAQ